MLFLQTLLVMVAFAANSLLCRAALANGFIEADSFTFIRLLFGAFALTAISLLDKKKSSSFLLAKPSFTALISGLSLFGYAALFSFAYNSLSTGTGALLLFGAVQVSLISIGLIRGQTFSKIELLGMSLSLIGFILLVLPSADQPPLWAAAMMAVAGICWAIFTRLGQSAISSQVAVTQGFIYASLIAAPLLVFTLDLSNISFYGFILAMSSGAITSGLGYYCWYQILPKLSLTQISVSQLSVPAIAMAMGAIFLAESLTLRSLALTSIILSGIALTFIKQKTL